MNFNQIHSFYLVAKLGTYQAAAERLHATQPAISARIAALESALNIRLFDRSGYRVSLTPEGRRFLPFAEKMLELQTEARVMIGNASEMSGVVRIGASDTMVSTWLPDFLIALGQSHPGISVEMFVKSSPLLREDLLNHAIDIAFLIGPISNPAVMNLDFCSCKMALVAAPSLNLHGRALTDSDLRGANLLTFEKLTSPYQDLKRFLKQRGIVAKLNPITALHSILILTLKGLGVGYLPLAAVQEDIQAGNLVVLQEPFELPSLQFSISYLDGPHRRIVEAIAESARNFLKAMDDTDFIEISY